MKFENHESVRLEGVAKVDSGPYQVEFLDKDDQSIPRYIGDVRSYGPAPFNRDDEA